MNKPIIATSFSGLFLKSAPWKNAHIQWFKNAAKKLNDPSIKELAMVKEEWESRKNENYFIAVDEVMKKMFPTLSDEERTIKAREVYFESVCEYIEARPNLKNEAVVDYFKELKKTHQLALITTNTKDAIERILKITQLNKLFDIIEFSMSNEKDSNEKVFDRFVKKYGNPSIYVGTDRKGVFDYCKQNQIDFIYVNLEKSSQFQDVGTATSLEELEKLVERNIRHSVNPKKGQLFPFTNPTQA